MLKVFLQSKPSLELVKRFLSIPTQESDNSRPWLDPWRHALPRESTTYTDVEEIPIDWSVVERLMPHEIIPEIPKHSTYPTPSGWKPPKSPPPSLPYYVRRTRDHLFPLFLERKRDILNEKTLDFEYVELVTIKGVDGDVFACELDLRSFLEHQLNRPVATHIDELKGRIKVKGADRSIIEKFLFEQGF